MKLTVLSRSYCHLCDDMVGALQAMPQHARGDFALVVIDIDQHPSLDEMWGDKVPVLLDGEVEICHYFLDHARLKTHLTAA